MTDALASLTEAFGTALRRYREQHDLTQDDVSRRVRERFGLRWGRPTISLMESGDRELSLTETVILLDALETDLTALLGDAGELVIAPGEPDAIRVTGANLVAGLVKAPMRKIVPSGASGKRDKVDMSRSPAEMDYKAAARLGR